jgi:hypothetical protein
MTIGPPPEVLAKIINCGLTPSAFWCSPFKQDEKKNERGRGQN